MYMRFGNAVSLHVIIYFLLHTCIHFYLYITFILLSYSVSSLRLDKLNLIRCLSLILFFLARIFVA